MNHPQLANCIIGLDKPAGITSFRASSKVREILRAKKTGHTGTLDPMATGLLLVCVDEATKVVQFLSGLDKEYIATLKLGEKTDTGDAEGRIIGSGDVSGISEGDVVRTVAMFEGPLMQKPPMYSAVKVNGQTLYKLARKGIEVDRQDRKIHIYSIKVDEVKFPFVRFTVSCSKGTYIRSLCEEIGMRLGTFAHLVSLRRTRIGTFDIGRSVSFDGLMKKELSYYSIDEALAMFDEILLDETQYEKARNGRPIYISKSGVFAGKHLKIKGPQGNLFAIGSISGECIRIERMLNL